MTIGISCPKCNSAKARAVPDSAVFICYTCKHEFTPPRSFSPPCIFLSYGRERYLIVIHALDEAGEAWRNPLVEMLARNAQRLPDWLGLVVTSRPEFDVKTPLQALNPFPLDTQSESNRADIRDYLSAKWRS